ncbi:MAG: DUF262 domain-containing protein [Patescibacteria group bacterium]
MKTRFQTMSINRLFKYRERIDLEPSFQREKVWSSDKQQHFLDTLLKGWGVPKLYLQLDESPSGKRNYICIDGKQRLTSVFSFLENRIPLSKKYSGEFGGKYYLDLPDKIQNKFDDYKLHIEEVTDPEEKEMSELFKRLQLGSPLNSGEKLMAIVGDMHNLVKKYSVHPFFKKKVALPNTRYAHFTVCAQVCCLETVGITDIPLRKLELFFSSHEDFRSSGFELKTKIQKIKEVLDYLNKMFAAESPDLRNRASVVSIYLLVSDLIDKGNIKGKENKLRRFFATFTKELRNEIEKGVGAKDAQFINYQSAIIQGADDQKSIKLRREILLNKLYSYDPFFYRIMHPQLSPIEKFSNLYGNVEDRLGNSQRVDDWLVSKKPRIKTVTCRGKKETFITHIRHCIHHNKHGKYTKLDLRNATNLLNQIGTPT